MQCDTRIEWASEGEQKPDLNMNSGVCETEQTLRKQSQHMLVCVKWAWYHVKPGGTAGFVYSDPVLANNTGTGSFCATVTSRAAAQRPVGMAH